MKIIKFEQEKCAPCAMVSNYLDNANLSYQAINAKDNPKESSKFGIMSVPVTILVDDKDNEVMRVNGYQPAKLQNMIDLINVQ